MVYVFSNTLFAQENLATQSFGFKNYILLNKVSDFNGMDLVPSQYQSKHLTTYHVKDSALTVGGKKTLLLTSFSL